MPFDASGNFTRDYNFVQDAANGIKILAARVDGEFDNVATGMNLVFFRDGRVPMQADLRMNINGITGLKDGTLGSPAIKFNSDPNTGPYLPGLNQYGIQVNSVQRMVATTTGVDVTGVLSQGGAPVATQAYVTGLAYAPLASPAFTGTPTAPTAAGGTNTTQIATTAFVQGILASPAFTGTPTAPTPATADNSTKLATTAYVQAQNYMPKSGGTFTGNVTVNGEVKSDTGAGLGVYRFGDVTKSLSYDGTNYQLAGAGLKVNGSIVPVIDGAGGMEVGKYVDFHDPVTDGRDYLVRFSSSVSGGVGVMDVDAPGGFNATGPFKSTGLNAGMIFNDRAGGGSFHVMYNSSNVFRIWFNTTGADKFLLDASGNATFGGNVTSSSDARLKSNIRQLEDGLAIVKALRGARFVMNGKADIGVIAQEVQAVLPELVRADQNGFLSVDYGRVVAPLIEAVKSLSERLDRAGL